MATILEIFMTVGVVQAGRGEQPIVERGGKRADARGRFGGRSPPLFARAQSWQVFKRQRAEKFVTVTTSKPDKCDRYLADVFLDHSALSPLSLTVSDVCRAYLTRIPLYVKVNQSEQYLSHYGDYALHPQMGRMFPSPLPTCTLDYIFLPPGCVPVHCEIIRSFASDHRPVLVDFELA
jgi:hypothetical protein